MAQKTGLVVESQGTTYEQYTTQDNLGRTITFYVTPQVDSKAPQPLIVYLNGSGFGSVFYKKDSQIMGMSIYPFLINAIEGRARLVLVEKPGVKLFDEAQVGGTCLGAPDEFLLEQTVERYTEAINASLRAAKALPQLDSTKLLVMGHSEGAEMAAYVAGSNESVTHVAWLAGAGVTQLFDFVHMTAAGTMGSGTGSAEDVEAVYQTWKEIQADPLSISKFYEDHPYRRWYSFLSNPPLDGLRKTKARIYIAKGTNDQASPIASFDVVRSDLVARGKDVVAERIEGADHALKVNSDSGIKDLLPDLVLRVINWYLQ
jgi:dienelactone hydrolase